MQPLLKALALAVAVLFLGGAVLTAMSDRALAAEPPRDAGAPERLYFPATKAAVMPRPKPRDAGEPVYFPASKSFGGESLPGVNQKLRELNPAPQPQSPQQNAAP
jgi:hypothetical protein